MMRPYRLLARVLLCLPFAAAAQAPLPANPGMPSNHPPVGTTPKTPAAPSPWSLFADYTLSVQVPPKGETGSWTFRTFADPADFRVDLDTPGPGGRTKGSMLLLGGRILAVRGFALETGFETDPLDMAIVNLKMLTQLLEAALPRGPEALSGSVSVSARDSKAPIVVSTPGMNARFDAPWHLTGSLTKAGADMVSFRLALDAATGDKAADRARWRYSGSASGTPNNRALDENMSLAGWKAYVLGPKTGDKPSSHASMRFAATPVSGPFATIKELRTAAK